MYRINIHSSYPPSDSLLSKNLLCNHTNYPPTGIKARSQMTTTKVVFDDTIAAFEEVEFVSRVMMVSEVGKKKGD